MIRSISFVMVLLFTVTTSLFAAGETCHRTEAPTGQTCCKTDSASCDRSEVPASCDKSEVSAGETCDKTEAASCDRVDLAPQTTCPVMGSDIDKTIYSDYNGERVYFCCSMCVSKFEADPETYLQVIKDNGEEPEHIVNIDG